MGGQPGLVTMNNSRFAVASVFIVLAIIFLAVSFRDYLKTTGETNPARQTWLRVGFIFAAVGIVLALMHF